MSNCQGKKFKVWAKLPNVSPSVVKFHFGNGNWQEKTGDSYQITEEYSSDAAGNIWGTFDGMGGYYGLYESRCNAVCYWTAFGVTLPIQYLDWGGGSWYGVGKNGAVFRPYVCSQYNYENKIPSPVAWSYIDNFTECGSSSRPRGTNLIKTQESLYQGSKNFVLTILQNGNPTHQETGSVSPTVELIPGSDFYLDDWLLWQSGFSHYGLSYQVNPDKSITLYDGENVIATLPTTNGSALSPSIRIDCLKTCPTNTCPIICNNTICCYSLDGYLVESFSL